MPVDAKLREAMAAFRDIEGSIRALEKEQGESDKRIQEAQRVITTETKKSNVRQAEMRAKVDKSFARIRSLLGVSARAPRDEIGKNRLRESNDRAAARAEDKSVGAENFAKVKAEEAATKKRKAVVPGLRAEGAKKPGGVRR